MYHLCLLCRSKDLHQHTQWVNRLDKWTSPCLLTTSNWISVPKRLLNSVLAILTPQSWIIVDVHIFVIISSSKRKQDLKTCAFVPTFSLKYFLSPRYEKSSCMKIVQLLYCSDVILFTCLSAWVRCSSVVGSTN